MKFYKHDKTPYFDGGTKPHVPGVYERRYPGGARFCCWDGCMWRLPSPDLQEAAAATLPSVSQSRPWRGLTYHAWQRAKEAQL